MKLFFVLPFLWSYSVLACEPCESNLGIEETIAQADLILIGQKIRDIVEPGIPPDTPPEIVVRIDRFLKGFVKEKELKVHSFSGECPYGIVVDEKSYLIFLKGPPYTAVNNGCAVKTLPAQEGLIEWEGRRLSPNEFAMQFGLGPSEKPKPDILFLVDLSDSMRELMGPTKRIECAKEALLHAVSKLPPEQEIALRVFGRNPQPVFDSNCRWDSQLLVPFGQGQKEKVIEQIKGFQAVGQALLSYAIVQTEIDFATRKDRLHKLIILSYGDDSCGDDPLLAARDIVNKGFALEVSVIGLDAKEKAKEQLAGIAKEFGGTFTNVESCQAAEQILEEEAVGAGGAMKTPKGEGGEEGGGGVGALAGGDSRMSGSGESCSPDLSDPKKKCGIGLWILLLLALLAAIWRYWKRKRKQKNKGEIKR